MRTLRLELTMVLTLAVSVTALVLALRGDSSPAVVAEDATGVVSEVPAGAAEVHIVNFGYDPEPARVRVGQPVAFTNFDSAVHTATASKGDGDWDTGYLALGETAVVTFDEPGTYAYFCTLHPPAHARFYGAPDGTILAGGGGGGMVGTIVVSDDK